MRFLVAPCLFFVGIFFTCLDKTLATEIPDFLETTSTEENGSNSEASAKTDEQEENTPLSSTIEKDMSYIAPIRYPGIHASVIENTVNSAATTKSGPTFNVLIAPLFDKENPNKEPDPCSKVSSSNPACNEAFNRHYIQKQYR